MVVTGAVGIGIVSNAIYDAMKLAASYLQASRNAKKARTELAAAIRHNCDVVVSDDEVGRLLALISAHEPETLLPESVAADPHDVLTQMIDRDVLLTASPEFARRFQDPVGAAAANRDRAHAIANGVWPSILMCLDSDQKRQLRADVAALQGVELATSVLHELQALVASVDSLETLTSRLEAGLPLERALLRPPPAVSLSPYEMLWARYGTVGFIDRGEWLPLLRDWCEDLSPIRCQIVHGSGGTGKTRLALELCREMSSRGWVAGLVHSATDAELDSLASETRPKLLVIDYADTRPDLVRRVVEALSASRPLRAHRVRFLLLVRRLGRQGDPRRWFIKGHQTRAATYIANSELLKLSDDRQAVSFGRQERRRLFARAVEDFTGSPVSTDVARRWHYRLDHDAFGTPLLVIVGALLAADPASDPGNLSIGELLDHVLDREEQTHWISCPETDQDLRRRAVAIATLFGANSEKDAVDLLGIEAGLGAEAERTRLALWMRSLYEGPLWLNGLEPDLLAERLVQNEIKSEWIDHAIESVNAARGRRALAVLGRLGASAPSDGLLGKSLAGHAPALVDAAIAEADGEPPEDSDVLADLLIPLLKLDDLQGVARRPIPPRVGSDAKRLALELKRLAAAQHRRAAQVEPSDDNTARLAMALDNLAIRSSEAGDFADALDPAEEAVELYEALATSDLGAHGSALIRALSNLSGRRAENGDPQGAAQASGRAVEVCRTLIASGDESHREGLAAALNNLAIDLAEIDEDERGLLAATEALDLYRDLSEVDTGFLADLAMASHNLSIDLGNASRRRDAVAHAVEAVEVFERLHDAQPLVYGRDLGAACHNLAQQRMEVGDLSAARDAINRALAVRRDLALADTQFSDSAERSAELLAEISELVRLQVSSD